MNSRSARSKKRNSIKISRGKKKKIAKFAILSLILFGSLSFLGIYSFQKYMEKSFTSAQSSTESYHVSQDDTPALLYIVVSDLNKSPLQLLAVNYLIFDKNNNRVLKYQIPLTYKFDMPGKYGVEELQKVFDIGALDSDKPFDYGIKAIQSSIMKIFGYKSDNYIIADQKTSGLFDDVWQTGTYLDSLKMWKLLKAKDSFVTNIPFNDFSDLVRFVKSLTDDRIAFKALDDSTIANTDLIDENISDVSLDSNISKETLNVAVLNGTNLPGVATTTARVVKNIGARIVAVGNTQKYYNSSVIITDSKDSVTCKLLARMFNINQIISKSEAVSFNESEIDRSDLVIIIGFDTAGDL